MYNKMVYLLPDEIIFPDPGLAEPGGLLAIGGDLSPERLVAAYHAGIFPWYSEGEPICWFAPEQRCVLFAQHLHVSRSLQKLINKNVFSITRNKAFHEVIMNCKQVERKGQEGTWITDDMVEAYIRLHELGIAQSIEAWKDGELAGGLYGVVINRVFCGESMFSRQSNASKIVLCALLRSGDYDLLDCQVPNPHLERLGATMISRNAFHKILSENIIPGKP